MKKQPVKKHCLDLPRLRRELEALGFVAVVDLGEGMLVCEKTYTYTQSLVQHAHCVLGYPRRVSTAVVTVLSDGSTTTVKASLDGRRVYESEIVDEDWYVLKSDQSTTIVERAIARHVEGDIRLVDFQADSMGMYRHSTDELGGWRAW